MISKATHILSTSLDDEIVMMDSEKGMYYNLDPVGSRIWTLLDTPQTLESLCKSLMDDYNIDETTCKLETEAFLQSLVERKLIVIT
jgi:Coenzyme PQQ synthesis protein D (PqqD)